MQTARRPERASSSTNVAANSWVGFSSGMETVTCLHGFSQHGNSWRELAALVPGSYRWLTPDVRAATLPEAEAELLALWEREGVQRGHVIGYSQGGRIALWAASDHPERLLSLITIGAHAGFDSDDRARRREEDAALADRIEGEGIDWFATHWAALPIFAGLARRGPDFLRQLDAARRQNDPARLAAQLRGMGAGAVEPFWDRLIRVSVPTLLLVGADDERYLAFANRLRSVIRDSAVVVIPGAGHAAHLERPAAVAAVLATHLAASPLAHDREAQG